MKVFEEKFIEYSVQYGNAFIKGKPANKFHSQLMTLYKNSSKEDIYDTLKVLLTHEEDIVRLWAATFLLPFEEGMALKELEKQKLKEGTYSSIASWTIQLWHEGMMKF